MACKKYPIAVTNCKNEHGFPVTQVLYRCITCNDIETKCFRGSWTLEQVRGE